MVATKWTIDRAHSEVTFKVRHLVISTVSGSFTDFAEVVASSVLDPDSVPGNGSSTEDDLAFVVFKVDAPAPPPQADLALEKEVGIEVTLPGGRKDVLISSNPAVLVNTAAVFFLKVTNLGPDAAKDILVKETLPAGFTIA